jgi:hypothetical protein
LPLSRIWAEGRIGFLEMREDRFGLFYIAVGVILIFAGLAMLRNASTVRDCVSSSFFLLVGSILSVVGSTYGRAAGKRVTKAKRRAARARHILDSMRDPALAPRMMEACYNVPHQEQSRSIFIEPIGQLLADMLPFADAHNFEHPSMQMRATIKRVLGIEWQTRPNLALLREVIHLVGRAGMTEYAGDMRRIAKLRFSPFVQRPAQACLVTLNGILEKQRAAELLVRASNSPLGSVDLLRPVDTGATERPAVLLRPVQDE